MSGTVLITGASRGIGAACARVFAQCGYRVYIIYKESKAQAEKLADETSGIALRCDVRDSSAVRALFEEIIAPDVLICSAGVAHYGLFTDITDAEWRNIFEINVGGVINCCRVAIPEMVRRKRGCIVTISSIWGIGGASCEAVYSASKAAVIGLTKSLAKELGPSGVRVNCVAPGVINTDMLLKFTEDEIKQLRYETPLNKIGSPNDVANTALFLASDAAAFITGQVINVSGGFLI